LRVTHGAFSHTKTALTAEGVRAVEFVTDKQSVHLTAKSMRIVQSNLLDPSIE
jgi:hypothetical protein